MPNPLSWFLHWGPEWTHRGGVLFNHFSELIVPFAYFLPQPVSSIAGAITLLFQGGIFLSGNLSWLNALTMVLAFSTFDDRSLSILLPWRPPQAVHQPQADRRQSAGNSRIPLHRHRLRKDCHSLPSQTRTTNGRLPTR